MTSKALPDLNSAKVWGKFWKGGLAVSLGVLIGMMPVVAMAQYNPPKRGKPGRREGAGTRGSCVQGAQGLMPLTPIDAFGTTADSQPVFFWYVPASGAQVGEFTLLDQQDRPIYQTTVTLPENPGLVGVRLPDAVPLQLEQDYYWQFSLICDAEVPSRNPFVEGVIQRVELNDSLKRQIAMAAPGDRANLYANAGIWYEALSTLANSRCTQPNDAILTSRWSRLLKSVDLGEYATASIAEYCTSHNPN